MNSVNDNGMVGLSVDGGSWEIAKLDINPDLVKDDFSQMARITSPRIFTQGFNIETMSGDLKMKLNYDFNGNVTSEYGLGLPFFEFKVTLDQHLNVHSVRIGSQEDIGKSAGGHAITTTYFTGVEYKPK